MPIYSPKLNIIAGSNISVTNTTDSSTIAVANVGSANGIASLDVNGKVPATQLPNSVMEYKGVWNAAINDPYLVDGVGNAGDVYRVGAAGTHDFGNGNISFEVGDYCIYSGSVWQKSDTTDAVTSVNTKTGAVVLTTADISDSTNKRYLTEGDKGDISVTNDGATWNIDDGAVSTAKLSSNAQQLSFRNLLINGNFAIDQRNAGAATSIANDQYCVDRFYVLTSAGNVTVSQQTLQTNQYGSNVRLLSSQTQRFGIAQIVEHANCRHLIQSSVVLNFAVRSSGTPTIRYAILEWTGSIDSVTSTIVSNWANANSNPLSGFFSTTNLNVLANGSVTASSTFTKLSVPLSATSGSNMKNLIVFVWTGSELASGVSVDIAEMQLENGTVATSFEQRPIGSELLICQRYWQQISNGAIGLVITPIQITFAVIFPAVMRAAPTITLGTRNIYVRSKQANGADVGGYNSYRNTSASVYIDDTDSSPSTLACRIIAVAEGGTDSNGTSRSSGWRRVTSAPGVTPVTYEYGLTAFEMGICNQGPLFNLDAEL